MRLLISLCSALCVALACSLVACSTAPLTPPENSATHNPLRLWYPQPASNWNQALPLGNDRLGAMVFGGVAQEELQLNEDTIWAGSPNNNVNPAAAEHIETVTRLLSEGKYLEAQKIANAHLQSASNHGMPYQTLGSLRLNFPGHENHSDYVRDLDINTAVASVSYHVNDVIFRREMITAFGEPVIAVHLSASKPGSIDLNLGFGSPQRHSVVVDGDQLRVE